MHKINLLTAKSSIQTPKLVVNGKITFWTLLSVTIIGLVLILLTGGAGASSAVAERVGEDGCHLRLSKNASPETILPGNELYFTLSIENIGEGDCTGGGVELKEYYDSYTNFVTSTPTPSDNDNIWNYGTVEPGEQHTIDITMLADEELEPGDVVTNKACVWAKEFGKKSKAHNWLCVETETPVVGQCHDNQAPEAGIEPENKSIILGEDVSYAVTDSNDPNDDDDLVYHWVVEEADLSQTGETFVFVPEESGDYTITLVAEDGCTTSTIQTTLTVEDEAPSVYCELTLTKTAFPVVVAPGDQIEYLVSLTNTGTANCTGGGVELKENYDDLTSFFSSDPGAFSSNDSWNFGTVEPGEEHTVDIFVEVSENAWDGDVITNEVCAWAREFGSKNDQDNWQCVTVNTPVEEINQCLDNETPVPVISPQDPTITLGNSINFDASSSGDSDGDILSFEWYVDGDLFSNDTEFTYTPDDTGIYQIELKAADQCGGALVETTLVVNEGGSGQCEGNSLPQAVAGDGVAALINWLVTLDGSGSTDIDGDTLSYTWEVPNLGFVDNEVITTVSFPTDNPEKNYATLTVSDECGSSTDTVEISVHSGGGGGGGGGGPSCPATQPTAIAGNNITVAPNEEFTLDGSASVDPEGDSLGFMWKIGIIGFESIGPTTTLSLDEAGTYIAELLVSDSCSTDSDILKIEVASDTSCSTCGGGGNQPGNPPNIPEDHPKPVPIVLGEATSASSTFTAPATSPRAGSGLPLKELGIGLFSGFITAIGLFVVYSKRIPKELT